MKPLPAAATAKSGAIKPAAQSAAEKGSLMRRRARPRQPGGAAPDRNRPASAIVWRVAAIMR